MPPTLSFLVTTVIAVVLFHLLDWLFWGTKWTHRNVFVHVPKEIWRLSMGDGATQSERAGLSAEALAKGGKQAMLLGALVTTFSAIVFVPMVWLIGPRFAGARVVLLAALFWAVFGFPGALYNSIYYRIPKQVMWLQSWAGLARVLVGLVAVTWLLTVFKAW